MIMPGSFFGVGVPEAIVVGLLGDHVRKRDETQGEPPV